MRKLGGFKSDSEVAEHIGIHGSSLSNMKYTGACVATRVRCMRALAELKRQKTDISPDVGQDGDHQQLSHLLDLIALIPKQDRMIGRAYTPEERAAFLRRSKRGN